LKHSRRRGSAENDIALFACGCAEVQACRTISHDPRFELMLRFGLPNVGFGRASRQVPIDEACIVTGGVRTRVCALAARPDAMRCMIAACESVDLSTNAEI
jgi:hypothetical protein